MFNIVLAEFSGTFFSYVCAFLVGVQLHALVTGTSSQKVIHVMNKLNDGLQEKLEKILKKI